MASLNPFAIVAAILLPPLGLFLVRGIGPSFWIAVALTCLGFLPGVIYALAAILWPHVRRREDRLA
jgi:uncharacterized membrane protein YqaE (UPF0057 family)